ncbi:MAG: transporter substrate-binding domain-containing protein [Pseudomonas sp.]
MSGRLIGCFLLLASHITVNTAHAAQQACTTLMAVVYANAEPYDWQEAETGVKQGLSVAVLEALAKKTGLNIHQVASKDAQKALAEVRSGRVDLIIGVRSDPKHQRGLDYLSPAYTQQEYRIWRRSAEQVSLQQWPQLSGLRGALTSKPLPGFEQTAQLLAESVRYVADDKVATQMVLDGRADYLIAEQHQQYLRLQKMGQLDVFEAVDPPVASQPLFVALAKDSACNDQALRKKLSQGLLALTQNGVVQNRLDAVMQRWQTLHPSQPSAVGE